MLFWVMFILRPWFKYWLRRRLVAIKVIAISFMMVFFLILLLPLHYLFRIGQTYFAHPENNTVIASGDYVLIATDFFDKITQQINSDPAYARGLWYLHQQQYEAARANFEQATALGNARAAYELGMMYAQGHGVVKNEKKAAAYFEQSANKGFAEAQNSLGYLYDNGLALHRTIKKLLHKNKPMP